MNEHKVYPTNDYAGTSTLIPIYPAGTNYASGSPEPTKTASFANYPIWHPNIPEYGTAYPDDPDSQPLFEYGEVDADAVSAGADAP